MKRILITNIILLVLVVNTLLTCSTDAVILADSVSGAPNFIGYAPDRIVVKFDPYLVRTIDKKALAHGRTITGIHDLTCTRDCF